MPVRMLALAVSETPVGTGGIPGNLILIGLMGIRDEVRPEARKAVSEIRGAGIQVVMITGDSRETASAIAREAGLLSGRDRDAVMTSEELNSLSDEQLKKRLPLLRVVARALPEDKSRLVRIAQQMGLVTGMTGDGINDAPPSSWRTWALPWAAVLKWPRKPGISLSWTTISPPFPGLCCMGALFSRVSGNSLCSSSP